MLLPVTITDLDAQADRLLPRAHGVIEVTGGRLLRVRLRPWPRIVSLAETRIAGRLYHRHWPGDHCRLYFNQPRSFPNFLVLKYAVTSAGTSWRTFHRALEALDHIARIKRSDALLCEASNRRISDRLLARLGWVPHCPGRRRHFIKRFEYTGMIRTGPAVDAIARVLATSAEHNTALVDA